jgi:tetratricopeptide (TPR) repeat protein
VANASNDIWNKLMGLAFFVLIICVVLMFAGPKDEAGHLPIWWCFLISGSVLLFWIGNMGTRMHRLPNLRPFRRNADFRKASRLIFSWARTYYRQGKLMERGNELRNMNLAQETIDLLEELIVEAQTQARSSSHRWALGIAHLELGFLYRMMNILDKAKFHIYDAVAILKELDQNGISNQRLRKDLGTALYRLAEVHHVSGEDRQALNEYKESLEIIGSLGDHSTAKVIRDQITNIINKGLDVRG